MDFIYNLVTGQNTAATVFYLCLAAFLGILIGKVKLVSIKLGLAGVLFSGLFISHFGVKLDFRILSFIRDFGLILYVYAIGLEVGPRFFSTFKSEGVKLNILSISVVVLGYGVTYLLHFATGVSSSVMTGIMCGAVTNIPALGAAQQLVIEHSAGSASMDLGCAITYPFGIIGVIFAMMVIKLVFRVKNDDEAVQYSESLKSGEDKLESVKVTITNQNFFDKEISYAKKMVDKQMVISRIFRDGKFIVATESEIIRQGDVLYGVATVNNIEELDLKIGKTEIVEKRGISGSLAMVNVVITNRKITGKTIQQIGIYRRYEANITRIFRAGLEILPTLDTTIELGDTVRVVGKTDLLADVSKELGNSMQELALPNTMPVFLGIIAGVILGSFPIYIPGLPVPAKLGLAGGPLIIAILLGHKGRIGKLDFFMSPGANMMLRELGIILFLACVGLMSGGKFVDTIYNGGYMWMLYGAAVTFIPVLIVGIVARIMGLNYLKICGILAGSTTNPPALEYANSEAKVQAQSTAYVSVYPLAMILRVFLAQIFVLTTF
jgi:putative transport protein